VLRTVNVKLAEIGFASRAAPNIITMFKIEISIFPHPSPWSGGFSPLFHCLQKTVFFDKDYGQYFSI